MAKWKGLNQLELKQLEIDVCAPMARAEVYQDQRPIGRCGLMLNHVFDQIEKIVERAEDDRKPLDQQDLARLIGRSKESYISALFNATARVSGDRTDWENCQKILHAMLLGIDAPEITKRGDERQTIAGRIIRLFFDAPDQQGVSRYFASTSGDPSLARSFAEVRYQLLWIAADLLRKGGSVELALVSGSDSYHFVAKGELTELGDLVLAVVLAGATLQLVYPHPDVVGETPAAKASIALRSAFEKQLPGKLPTFSSILMEVTKADVPTPDVTAARLRLLPVDPTAVFRGAGASAGQIIGWGGQFLSPFLRFGYVNYSRDSASIRQAVYILRHENLAPFAIPTDAMEREKFLTWLEHVKNMQDEKRGQ